MIASNQFPSDAYYWAWLIPFAILGLLSLRGGLRYRKQHGRIPHIYWVGIYFGGMMTAGGVWGMFAN